MSKIKIYDESVSKLERIDWDFEDVSTDPLSLLHPYPARFINSIPKELIKNLDIPNNTGVFDPFCGSGTTLYEAQKAGLSSTGVDLNPIACLISRVKLQKLEEGFDNIYENILSKAQRDLETSKYSIPAIPNLDHWFKKDIQLAITSLVNNINNIEHDAIRDALFFALSSIIVRVSNQESDTRYAAIQNNYNASDVFNCFRNSCKKLLKFKTGTEEQTSADFKVINNDILSVKPDDITNKIGLVITSPPYPNAYEYWLYHKYRMWWLGYNPISVRTREIGARPHYQKKNGQTAEDFKLQMSCVADLLDNTVCKNGYACIVIGRSIIKGEEIDNAALITDIFNTRKYKLCADIERNISSTKKSFNLKYGKIKTEHILIFRKEN